MKNSIVTLRTALLATLFLLGSPATSMALPLQFTYDCTIDGTGQIQGLNACAGGPTIAQVLISDAGFDYDNGNGDSDVLKVEARLQFWDPNPPGNNDPYGYQIDAIWLNIDESLLGTDAGNAPGSGTTGIAWSSDPNLNSNYIWFDFAQADGSFDGTFDDEQIEVAANSTEASSWKDFDLGLCSQKQSPADCALDLPVTQDPANEPRVTLGFLNSGNLFNLKPENFDYLTSHPTGPDGKVWYDPCGNPITGELGSAIKINPRAPSGSLDSDCLSGGNYGPRYGAAGGGEELPPSEIPEPSALGLLGFGLLGLAAARRRSRKAS